MLNIQPAKDWTDGAIGFFDLDEKTYRRASGLSQSLLKLALHDPFHVLQAQRCPMVATSAMECGTLAHCLILEPHLYGEGKSHVCRPKTYTNGKGEVKPFNANSTECKAWLEANEDMLILSAKDQRTVENMADAFKFHPLGKTLLDNGHTEVSCFWMDAESGLMMKSRFDILAENDDDSITIVDLKKVGQESEHDFIRSCCDLEYPIQNAVYRAGASQVLDISLDKVRFIHASIPDKAPHCVSFRQMLPTTMRKGEELMRKAITKYAEAKHTGVWTTIQGFDCPDYYLNR